MNDASFQSFHIVVVHVLKVHRGDEDGRMETSVDHAEKRFWCETFWSGGFVEIPADDL